MKLKLAIALASLSLSGCYVVPIDTRYPPAVPQSASYSVPVIAPQPIPAVLHARLYPLNETAGKMGALNATVTDHANGHAVFSLAHDGEILQGEASRIDGKRGVAGAAGPRGTYVKCEYVLAAHNRGTGSCQFSNGARYQLHFGS